MAIFLGLLPIIVIFVLLAFFRRSADLSGLIGWFLMALIARFYFHTPINVILIVSLAGVISSLPITMVVATSLLQMTYMEQVGAIKRLVVMFKTVSHQDRIVQILLINIGFGTLMTALGAVPVSILPPIMLALGYSSFVAIALPAIGYDALCTYALLGVPVIIFANFTGIEIEEAGKYFARYMPVISTLIAFGMLWIAGKWNYIRRGWFPTLLAGLTAGFTAIFMNYIRLTLLTGVAAGIGVIVIMMVYLKIRGKPVFNRDKLTPEDKTVEGEMSLLKAFSPWILLVLFSIIINIPGPVKDFLFTTLSLPVNVIPGTKPISTRVFFHAYWWILVSTLLVIPIFQPGWHEIKSTLSRWLKRAPRPSFSAAIFFAIAYVMNYSGMDSSFHLNPDNNIIASLARGSSELFGKFYGLIAPYLGLLGGFISGSETSSIAMLTKFHLTTSGAMWGATTGLLIAAASGIGGGLASVISPAKLQNASAIIDRIGEEGVVMRTTFVISLIITGVCAVMTFMWSFF
jgi:lactate permease